MHVEQEGDKKYKQEHTTRAFAFRLRFEPMQPLPSQFFIPDFIAAYVFSLVAFSGPYFFACKAIQTK